MHKGKKEEKVKFLLPTGVGDSCWALFKIQAIRDKLDPGGTIDVSLVGSSGQVDSRAIDFVKRFSFVNSVNMKAYEIHNKRFYRKDGCYDYIEDGMYEFDGDKYCVLIPNEPLERGVRLEEWLPQYPINWNIFKQFRISPDELDFAVQLKNEIGPYAVFYPGPLHGNTIDGHNRNGLWKPEDWIELGKRIHEEFGLEIVTVGAVYDASYYSVCLKSMVSDYWHNLIGKTNLGQLWAVTGQSKFLISYQAGVGIIATYLGTPTGIFWRPNGDSISPNVYLSFNEKMASAWVPPAILEKGTHLPLIYGKHGPNYVMNEIRTRRWA